MRPKHIYRVIIGVLFILAFFGIVSLPKDWLSAKAMLTGIETWWNAHAAYPALTAFIVGLAFATILLPECLALARAYAFPSKPKPDLNAALGFKTIVAHSRRAKELVKKGLLTVPLRYESHLTELGVTEGRLKVQLADEIHDLLRLGELTAWGSPDNRKPHQEIRPDEWSEIEIDFDDRDMTGDPPRVHAIKRGNNLRGSVFGYLSLRFSGKQLYKAFPLAFWPRKISDAPKEKGFVNTKS